MELCTCGRIRHYMIRRSPHTPSNDRPDWDRYPWYVQETTHGDDRDDYGSVGSFPEALEVVHAMSLNSCAWLERKERERAERRRSA